MARTNGLISSVIALAESESRSKQAAADEGIRNRQFDEIMRVALKTLVLVGVFENCGKESLPPSQHFSGFLSSAFDRFR
jgi:hypothetical protein